MKLFEKVFNQLLHEDIAAGDGGAFGTSAGAGGDFPGGRDFYAPGDARMPTFLGAKKLKRKKKKSKKKKSKKKKSKKKVVSSSYIPIQRRTFAPLLANISGMTGPSGKAAIGSV